MLASEKHPEKSWSINLWSMIYNQKKDHSIVASQLQGFWLDLELRLMSVYVVPVAAWASFRISSFLLTAPRCAHVCAWCQGVFPPHYQCSKCSRSTLTLSRRNCLLKMNDEIHYKRDEKKSPLTSCISTILFENRTMNALKKRFALFVRHHFCCNPQGFTVSTSFLIMNNFHAVLAFIHCSVHCNDSRGVNWVVKGFYITLLFKSVNISFIIPALTI